jgi:DNA-binding response OmpR family regulator
LHNKRHAREESQLTQRFLIIDDHDAYRQWLGHHLASEWAEGDVELHVPSGSDVLPPDTEPGDFDLLFLDYQWQDGDAVSALRELKAMTGCPPVIFMTAQGDHKMLAAAIEAGADDILPKGPITHQDLVDMVKQALGRGRRERTERGVTDRPHVDVPQEFSLKGHTLIGRVARGGVSAIYLMRNDATEEEVIVKVLKHGTDEDEAKTEFDRFLQEYELISAIKHKNIVQIFDLGIADDHAFIVMEYFPKGDLKMRIGYGLGVDDALDYLEQMASALDAIHTIGVLHRDLKPGNVMLRKDGSLALIDFGLAKRLQMSMDLTLTGEIFGTPYYMSPEQGQGEPADERADIYSLGIIFYEMLTRRKPYAAASPMAVIYKHAHAQIPALPEAAAGWQWLFQKMVAKHRDDRPASAKELLAMIRADRRRAG